MKFKITMKSPNGVADSVDAALEGLSEDEREERKEKIETLLSKWFEFGEYLTVEVDTDAESIRVCERI